MIADILPERICDEILFDYLHKDMWNISHSTKYFTSRIPVNSHLLWNLYIMLIATNIFLFLFK